jgi:hypothetical protein
MSCIFCPPFRIACTSSGAIEGRSPNPGCWSDRGGAIRAANGSVRSSGQRIVIEQLGAVYQLP